MGKKSLISSVGRALSTILKLIFTIGLLAVALLKSGRRSKPRQNDPDASALGERSSDDQNGADADLIPKTETVHANSNQANPYAEEQNTRDRKKFVVETATLAIVVIYTSVNAFQACETKRQLNAFERTEAASLNVVVDFTNGDKEIVLGTPNYGHVTAEDVSLQVDLVRFKPTPGAKAPPITLDSRMLNFGGQGWAVPPVISYPFTNIPSNVSSSDHDEMDHGLQQLAIWGGVTFNDGFKHTITRAFCAQYGPRPQWIRCANTDNINEWLQRVKSGQLSPIQPIQPR